MSENNLYNQIEIEVGSVKIVKKGNDFIISYVSPEGEEIIQLDQIECESLINMSEDCELSIPVGKALIKMNIYP